MIFKKRTSQGYPTTKQKKHFRNATTTFHPVSRGLYGNKPSVMIPIWPEICSLLISHVLTWIEEADSIYKLVLWKIMVICPWYILRSSVKTCISTHWTKPKWKLQKKMSELQSQLKQNAHTQQYMTAGVQDWTLWPILKGEQKSFINNTVFVPTHRMSNLKHFNSLKRISKTTPNYYF